MKVREIMNSAVETITPEASVSDAARIMRDNDIGAVPVVESGNVLGILTDRDIVIRATANGRNADQAIVGEIMTNNYFWCYGEQEIGDAIEIMRKNRIRRLVVLDHHDHVRGIVSLSDIAGDPEILPEDLKANSKKQF